MLKCLNVKMTKRGFTLIEMLVAVTIFSIIIGAALGVFVSAIQTQKRTLSWQIVLDQSSYVLEYMSRALRMAKKQTAGEISCLSQNGLNYENPGGDVSKIKFINYKGECQEFFLENQQLKENKTGNILSLTSNDLQVTSLKFYLSGAAQSDYLQPRATIFLGVKGKGVAEEQPRTIIQTTISQRNLDVRY